ncbi:hypothetical protein, partial [Streptomyces aurantiogriseus]|uniref:hypothetical protein n=1 Tax=Streptomyces aurantiogriseus TaxID=66870 RepID=UPI001E3F3570
PTTKWAPDSVGGPLRKIEARCPANGTGRELGPSGRVGITVQRTRKSCGSWWITVDEQVVVNIAVTHTGDRRTAPYASPAEQSDDYER